MRGSRRFTRAGRVVVFASALIGGAVPRPAAAQAQGSQVTWFLKGLQTGLCVNFLVAPDYAAGELHRGLPTPAESLATEFPALDREVRSDPPYRGWVPAEYCWFLYDSAAVGGKNVTVDGGRQPVVVGYYAIRGTGVGDGANGYAVDLFTNAGPLLEATTNARLRVAKIKFTKGKIPDQEEVADRFRLVAQQGGTTIQWDGGPGTPVAPTPFAVKLSGLEITNTTHPISAVLTPDSTFTPTGDFRVLGDGDLQSALSKSPIRFLRNVLKGGNTDWILGG